MNPFSKKYIRRRPAVVANAIKYHPGHYTTHFKNTDLTTATILNELRQYPCNRGWQLRLNPDEMEGAEPGDYSLGFAKVDAWLTLLENLTKNEGVPVKRLILLIEFKSLHKSDSTQAEHVAPAYMRPYHAVNNPTGDQTNFYGGGDMLYTSTEEEDRPGFPGYGPPYLGGWVMNYMNVNVRNRMIAMMQAYGARYNKHVHFEGIGSVEAAFQRPDIYKNPGTETFNQAALDIYNDTSYIGLLKIMQAMKLAFPNCFVYLFCNYPREKLQRVIRGGTIGSAPNETYVWPGLVPLGIGIGGPNTAVNEFGLGGVDTANALGPPYQLDGLYNPGHQFEGQPNPNEHVGIYSHYRGIHGKTSVAGQVPIGLSGQRPDWNTTKIFPTVMPPPAGGHTPTVEEVFSDAIDDLQTNYFFITRATAGGGTYPLDKWAPILAYWDANPDIKNNPTGGCKTVIPSSYAAVDMS